MTDQLAGIADLMARWGYTRQGVHKLTKLPDFPAPIAVDGPVGAPFLAGG